MNSSVNQKYDYLVNVTNGELRPGFGFHYITQEPAPGSIIPELALKINSAKLLNVSTVCDFIKRGVIGFDTSDYKFDQRNEYSASVELVCYSNFPARFYEF